VLRRLKKHGAQVKLDKCQFLQESVEYLGYRIDAEGLHTTSSKLEAIVRAPRPTNIQELRAFLGLLNYYGRFIRDRATITQPLNNPLRKDTPWKWTENCSKAFQEAKDALVSSTCVTHYDPLLPLRLAADASAYRVGAVIFHLMPDGQERPIAFVFRTLSKSEKNYSQMEKRGTSSHLWCQAISLISVW
jgi:hypothetical protein